MRTLKLCVIFCLLTFSTGVYANAYKCAQMVYKGGWFRKYEVKGNTWGANTKKHGAVSSTAGSTTETTTASVDPGVSTNQLLSSAQYLSSWGECAALDMEITQEFRSRYIKQNIVEIKKQIVIGDGYHIDSLALLSGCKGIDRSTWINSLRRNTENFYDAKDEVIFDAHLKKLIHDNSTLTIQCKIVG